jgi:hypothetical protein
MRALMMVANQSKGGQGGMKPEDIKKARDFIRQVLERVIKPGSTELPKRPPF